MKPEKEAGLWMIAGGAVWTLGGLYSLLAFIGIQGVSSSKVENYLVTHGLIAVVWLGLGGAFFYIGRRIGR